ncbi:MAG: laccase domain-containing protein [Rugosibacter sp.]|nr:laccase domain-containing protein [Rugosibacter sp.]
MTRPLDLIVPDWPAPRGVRALVTTRQGGVSGGPWTSLNLASHVGDDAAAVAENRARLCAHLPSEPPWLTQVHGVRCVDAATALPGVEADASFTRARGVVCAVLTADCLPLLLCDENASVVTAVHAGWRGLADGVIEASVAALAVPGEKLLAWLGPAIGPQNFEVGAEVRAAFLAHDAAAASAFSELGAGKWRCDIYHLARQRLAALGIHRVFNDGLQRRGDMPRVPQGDFLRGKTTLTPGASALRPCGEFCTVRDGERFYSFRRDNITGRMASCIWLE